MIVLITGASHTGKTALAQELLEKYKACYDEMIQTTECQTFIKGFKLGARFVMACFENDNGIYDE